EGTGQEACPTMTSSKQRATCSQEKWELTISRAARDRQVRVSGLLRSSRQWAAKCCGVSARRMSRGGLTERPSARHLSGCQRCTAEVAAFVRFRETLPELKQIPEVPWNRVAAEMRANIRLSLAAG